MIASSAVGAWITSHPTAGGTARNGMYAGVGRTTGLPGGVNRSTATCSPATTSASGVIQSGRTSQP